MGGQRRILVRLAPDEVDLLLQGLDLLQAEDEFTRKVQPAHAEQSVAASTRLQALDMLRAVLARTCLRTRNRISLACVTSGIGLPERWQAYKQEPFAVHGLPDDADFDEADWALLDATVAGYVDRAVGNAGLSDVERREVERLTSEIRRWLPALTSATGQEQMRTLAALADDACHYRP